MSSLPPVLNPEIERALETQIAPWLEHMRWRSDFAEWRQRRLWQENYQRDAVDQVQRIAASHASTQNGLGNKPRILDLGAGMGGFAVAMQRAGERIIAFDYNFAYCEIARTRALRYGLNLPALVGAGEHLPFADRAFHVVTCWDVLEHVQNPARLLGEISRVLAEDGIAFLSAINRLAWVDPHYHLRGVNYLPRAWGEKYIAWRQRTKQSALRDRQRLSEMHYFTYDELQRLAAQFHFRVQDLNKPRSRFNKYPRPIGDFLYNSWRTFGMGTYHLVLYKLPSPTLRISKALDESVSQETLPTPQSLTTTRSDR